MSTAGHSPTEVSEAPWAALQLLLPPPKWRLGGPGRKPLDLRHVIHGMVSVNKTGCQWRMRPPDIGHGQTIYGDLRRWRLPGLWERGRDTLRQWARQKPGASPRAVRVQCG
jgi:putative transposase